MALSRALTAVRNAFPSGVALCHFSLALGWTPARSLLPKVLQYLKIILRRALAGSERSLCLHFENSPLKAHPS